MSRKRFYVSQDGLQFAVVSLRSEDKSKYPILWGQFRTNVSATTFSNACNAGRVPCQADVSGLNKQPGRVRKPALPKMPIPSTVQLQDAVQDAMVS